MEANNSSHLSGLSRNHADPIHKRKQVEMNTRGVDSELTMNKISNGLTLPQTLIAVKKCRCNVTVRIDRTDLLERTVVIFTC